MNYEWIQNAEKYTKRYRRNKRWQNVVRVLSCIVVFCTTYALILPAITLDESPSCGLAEHQHDFTCYLAAEETDGEPVLLCEKTEHLHSDACFVTSTDENTVRVLTAWEQEKVDSVITLIDAMPDADAIYDALAAYEDAEDYRVADVSETGAFTLTGDFAAYPVTLQNLSDTEWQQLADTLVGYVGRDGLTALDSGKTDTDGTLVFPCQQQNLHPGLYLVVIQRLQEGRYTYIAKPFLTCLPGLLQNEDTWAYDVIVTPKYERDYDTSDTPATVTRKVLKVWKDDGKKSTRPKEITVQLLQNGSVYDTVALREDNNWRYTWEKLNKNYDWTVVEKEVDGYTVRVSQEGTAFVITNTYDADVPETTTAVTTTVRDPAEPPSASTEPPSEPIEPENTPNRPQLPATGQLWWPVTVLAAVGLLLILAGVLWNRGADDEA